MIKKFKFEAKENLVLSGKRFEIHQSFSNLENCISICYEVCLANNGIKETPFLQLIFYNV